MEQNSPISSGEFFDTGFCCAESVLLSIARQKGIESDLIPKIATGFCGGISRSGNICGAVSGAVMALGIFYGREAPDQTRYEFYKLVRQLMDEFAELHGSTNCRQLTGCNLLTPEGEAYYKANQIRQKCRAYSETAARLALAMI